MKMIWTFLLSVLPLCSQQPGPAPLNVCEALSQRQSYQGRMVSIRGVLSRSEHGTWVASPSPCEPPIRTEGYQWEPIIWLTSPGDRDVGPRSFIRDLANRDAYQKLLREADPYGTKRILVTIHGQFETYSAAELPRRKVRNFVGEVRFLGYGPLNGALARLVIESVSLSDIDLLDSEF